MRAFSRHLLSLLLTGLLVGALATDPVQAQSFRTLQPEAGIPRASKRVALVLGNAAYRNTRPLTNPTNDATDIAAALRRLDFEVVLGTDLERSGMVDALRSFRDALVGADIAFFFYAGHGVEVDGENYMIPVDLDADASASDLRLDAFSLSLVADMLEGSHLPLNVIVLDACRNNPFENTQNRNLTGGGGWQPPRSAPPGSIISYGTALGSFAADNAEGRNGLFTQMLLAEIEKPGLEFRQVLNNTGRRVYEASAGQQSPWMTSNYYEEVYLVGGGTPPPPPPPPSDRLIVAETRAGQEAFEAGDLAAAVRQWQSFPAMQDPYAQVRLGYMYDLGLGGLVEDDAEAVRLYQRASDRSVPWARVRLGMMHQLGLGGLNQDVHQAARLYRLAGENGNAEGLALLAALYETGPAGFDPDPEEAARLYAQAADLGLDVAQYALGFQHETGALGTPDREEALRLYRLAADQGFPPALAALQRLTD